ncbi:Na+:solute symporter [Paenibacillus filicis]|uniref:Na+:solute symporter n=1 Tax=Paenibacillus gyeongsangnamensis TaxID=3388067 RepID=A0ABT4Q439_9BACL|nr:sodium:solute symporter family protein [Paenibacillus filicis]MCZ8511552.1 Na+:solute symporter [Paenibacillus filicis]
MSTLDWVILALFFLVMIGIGMWSHKQVHDTKDYFTAGGKMPWWLSGISHHMSGYSAVAFVGYAAVAYTNGFTLYVWWAFPIGVAIFIGSFIFAPRWSRLRDRYQISSPMEYLTTRYNLPVQQVLAWSGVALKIFDVGAKWTAIAIVLQVFTGMPLIVGILLSGGVSLIYSTIGGLWADALTDFAQFIIQFVAGIVLFVVVIIKLGGMGSLFGIWSQLPPEHSHLLNGPYTGVFVLALFISNMLSYNGGTWNLAQRYMASKTGSDARKSAILSAVLYLIWPLVLFFPMWAAPLLLPNLKDPSQSYAILATTLLPPGLIGLVLAGLFSHTMAMTTSDANAISAVVTQDILPVISKKISKGSLKAARITTFIFVFLTMVIAANSSQFGGVLGLILLWFQALIGPTSVPMLFGLLPAFRNSGPSAAFISWLGGLVAFALLKYVFVSSQATLLITPIAVTLVLYVGIGLFNRNKNVPLPVTNMLKALDQD